MGNSVRLLFWCIALSCSIAAYALTVEERLLILEKSLFEKDERIASLGENMREQRGYISNLEDVIRAQWSYIESIETRINDIEGRNNIDDTAKPSDVIEDLNSDNHKIGKSVLKEPGERLPLARQSFDAKKYGKPQQNHEERQIYEKRLLTPLDPTNPAKIAFYAEQKTSTTYGLHETLRFTEILDIGAGFNEQDSIFDAPVSGVYVFTWSITNNVRTYIQVQLMLNGHVSGSSFSDSEEINDIHPSSGTVILRVNKGDHVSLRRGVAATGVISSNNNWATVMFAGYLIFE